MTSKKLASNLDLRRQVPLSERLLTEGDPYSTYAQLENVTLADGNTVASFLFPSIGRAFWIESLELSSNKAVALQIALGTGVQSNLNQVRRIHLGAGSALSIPIRTMFRPLHQSAGTTALGSATVRKAVDVTSGAYVYAGVAGWQIYDDLNFGADKVMLHIGDSISNDTTGVTAKTTSMLWQTRGYFKAKGQNVRVINKSVSGSTTNDHEVRRKQGGYDFPQVDYIGYQVGSNDASNSVPAATAAANLAAMIVHKQKFYPDAKMVVFGPTPLENNTHETNLVAIRTALQAEVTAAADPTVLWCSLAAAFDRTNASFYAGTDTPGSRVHPDDDGHAAAYAVIQTFLDANLPLL